MTWLLGLLCVAALINGSVQKATPESSFYKAAVVEYVADRTKSLEDRTADYVDYINRSDAEDVDIIVFPESTLTDKTEAQTVPDASQTDGVVPCDDDQFTGNPIRQISCAARNRRMYVVINLTMKRKCSVEQEIATDHRPCAENDLNLYNTNVVFDRNGAVISTYRKVNLFGEIGINTTVTPDVSWFDTDFDVRFGHFICFDLMFDVPALNLIDLNVRNFAYPTMWFSEMPFLTAVQAQQSWAYKHNVNFLAAGANNPRVGSTGSGIYAGRQGAIKSVMLGTSQSHMMVSEISKIPGDLPRFQPEPHVTKTPDIFLKRDQLDVYKHVIIDSADETEQAFDVCHTESNLCCHFAVKLAPPINIENTVTYSYIAAVYHGNRTFDGFADGDVLSCSILPCTNNEDMKTCGVMHASDANVVNRHRFTQIIISGAFPTKKTLLMPTTLDIGVLPLNSEDYEYIESEEFMVDEMSYKRITMTLVDFNNHLLTFGIYGRDFSSSATHSFAALVVVVSSVLAHYFF